MIALYGIVRLALLYNCPRAASVQAVQRHPFPLRSSMRKESKGSKPERSVLWELDRESFNNIVGDFSFLFSSVCADAACWNTVGDS